MCLVFDWQLLDCGAQAGVVECQDGKVVGLPSGYGDHIGGLGGQACFVACQIS